MAKQKPPLRTHLSRHDMEQIIGRGECVLIDGEVVSKVEDLPSSASLASSPEEAKRVRDANNAEIARLKAENEFLDKTPVRGQVQSTVGTATPAK